MRRRGSRLRNTDIPALTMSSTSVSNSWSPSQITNSGSTLEWTVSNGVTIAKTIINDPTFDFSGNTGTADILVEKIDGFTELDINELNITELYLRSNTALTYLLCNSNSISVLDVSLNTELTVLFCAFNQISELDVSTNTELAYLNCQDNSISTLDVSLNTALTYLHCHENNQDPAITDQIFIDLDANGKSNGNLSIRNNRTSASDGARANLITKGWSITDTYTS